MIFPIIENEAFTSKNSEVFHLGLLFFPYLIWRFLCSHSEEDSIPNVAWSIHRFSSKFLRNILVKKHYSCYLLYHTVLPFNNPILLWSFWGREFLLNSMLIAKCFKLCILKFLPMITFFFLDDGKSLFILKLLAKFFHLFTCFRLFSKEFHARVPWEIINHNHDVPFPTHAFRSLWTH